MKKLSVSLLLLISSLWASSSIGTATGQFLEVNMHVRNMGMGNAATSLVQGSSAALVNPAGIVDFTGNSRFDSYASYVNWPADITFGAVGVAMNMGSMGFISINTVYANYGDELRTTPDMPFGDGYFSIGGMSIGVSYSKYVTDKFSFGITMKNVSEKYDDSGYSQFAWDIGTLYRTGYRNLNIGMSILNFSKEAQFDGEYLDYSDPVKYALNDSSSYGTWPLPMTFRTGISFDVWNTNSISTSIAMDMIHSNNSDEVYGFGTELIYLGKMSIRGGYQFGTDIQGLTLGGGLHFFNNIGIDYAFNAMEYLGPRHRFALSLKF